ncbi:CDP-alcohol phosphatidyltransferase family protein [Polaribacter vadi]|uniref:CDP-alcohol phosphatidyltransferase family protein n=1 Tax=Polaribacter TaxID=52959 RepID=UPI001C09DA1C|nr:MULTISPECIES: CDP-alcohol phosphatidyltransferase family protein [Polaribacter]MBU3012559.1 CDP-alcohol phosphatidyltransferase family protein [Polaribacter vadi]MDO6742376.1 CDP-alcohol phosphatidyltransferase family protein [Polaribacter sp. 1_MG-2023]
MKIIEYIPNLLTLGNLFCGTVAAIYAVEEDFVNASIFVLTGILFDFFDGFAARLLKVTGELGKQLDSLADMVTSGVVPGIIMLKLIQNNLLKDFNTIDNSFFDVSLIGLILTLGACYRLGKFNIDTRQTDSFIGLPTPAMCLFVISLPLIQEYSDIEFINNLIHNNYFLIAITWVLTYLMNADIPLFSLKFKDYSLKNNWVTYLFLTFSLVLILLINYLSIPIIITLYILLSIIKNLTPKI